MCEGDGLKNGDEGDGLENGESTRKMSPKIEGAFVYRGLEEMIQDGGSRIPADFVLPPHLQPGRSLRTDILAPVIDLTRLNEPEGRQQIVANLAEAGQTWGFFQVVGHTVPEDLRERMLNVARKFFELPVSEKIKFSRTDVDGSSPSFGRTRITSSGHHSWRDLLKHRSSPLAEGDLEKWPLTPEIYRETVMEYDREIKKMSDILLDLLSEGLNLDSKCLRRALGEQKMSYTILSAYYPPCPQPHLALGVIGHTDPNPMTILIQDEQGLEVMKDGYWVPVAPLPNGFSVTLGDVLQILTNGKYASSEHRVVTRAEHDRISVMLFVQPQSDVRIGVVPDLLSDGTPARYTDTTWTYFLKTYGLQGLDHKVTDIVRK